MINKKTNWTVMIYMAGDNNLSVDMAYALEELQNKVYVSEKDSLSLFVHYVNNSPEIPSIYCDFSDLEKPLFKYSVEIKDKFSSQNPLISGDLGAVTPVIDFVDWCQKRKLESESNINSKYLLIFSGHTMGFFSSGLLKNQSANETMTIPNLQQALGLITKNIIGKKLSMLGFDSCVMSMFEVGYQFKDVSETMVASEGSIPNAGWTYSEMIKNLNHSKPNIKKIVTEYVFNYIEKQSNYSIGGVSVDMSAWDFSKLNQLTKKFNFFAKSLLDCFKDRNSPVYKQMRRIMLQVHFNAQTYMFEQNIDLGDFCLLLINEIESLLKESNGIIDKKLLDVKKCCLEVIIGINECILLSGFSGGDYQYSTGISLFFPWSKPAYEVSKADYQELDFIRNTNAGKIWDIFLQKYLYEVSLRKAINSTDTAYLIYDKASERANINNIHLN